MTRSRCLGGDDTVGFFQITTLPSGKADHWLSFREKLFFARQVWRVRKTRSFWKSFVGVLNEPTIGRPPDLVNSSRHCPGGVNGLTDEHAHAYENDYDYGLQPCGPRSTCDRASILVWSASHTDWISAWIDSPVTLASARKRVATREKERYEDQKRHSICSYASLSHDVTRSRSFSVSARCRSVLLLRHTRQNA